MSVKDQSAKPKPSSKKNSFTNADRYIAVDYFHKHKIDKSIFRIVLELRKEYPERFGVQGKLLNSECLRKWNKKYIGLELEKLRDKAGFRSKKKTYPDLREAVINEIKLREKDNLMRDVETMQMWAMDKAEELSKTDPKYNDFKGSRKFINCIVNDEFSKRTITGTSELTISEFIKQRREWLDDERVWLIDNDYVDDEIPSRKDKDNLDEIPIVLKGEPKKQVTSLSLLRAISHNVFIYTDIKQRIFSWYFCNFRR